MVYIFFHKSTNVNYYVSLFVDIPIHFVDISVGFSIGFSITGNYFQYVGTSNGQNPTSWPQKNGRPLRAAALFFIMSGKSRFPALLNFDLPCENFLVVFNIFLKQSRCIQSVRTLGPAHAAFDAGLRFLHFVLPVFCQPRFRRCSSQH